MHVSVEDIAPEKWLILALATLGVLLSTVLVGLGFWGAAWLIGVPMDLLHCLLFGALISPTDPIAVLAVLKRLGVPKSLGAGARPAGLRSRETVISTTYAVVVFSILVQALSLQRVARRVLDQEASRAPASLSDEQAPQDRVEPERDR